MHIISILCGSWDRLESGTKELILIQTTKHPILPNSHRPFWTMWRMETVSNIDMCQSINTKVYWGAMISPQEWFQNPVNYPLIYMIRPAMMMHTKRLTMWLRLHLDEAIAQYAYWPPPGSHWIHRLEHQTTGVKWIQISMITTPTQ